MPPVTPRTMRRPDRAANEPPASPVMTPSASAPVGRLLDRLLDVLGTDVDDLAGRHLFQRDRQGLARHRGHLGRNDRTEPVAQLVEVRVDLTTPLRRQG